ncbi:MAG: tyrosine-type recombinase/integrase [Rhodoblastus sp.]
MDTWWKRLLERCGINDLHFHDLRHEATSRLFERGLSTIEVMSVTGHSTSEMVDSYSHYSAGLVLDKLEQGIELNAILDEVRFLARQYLANGGKLTNLKSALDSD